MNYIIVRNSSFDDFINTSRAALVGQTVSAAYLEHVDQDGKDMPGGWGCLRFTGSLPNSPIFPSGVEYRYSTDADAWLAGGQQTELSDWVKTLSLYFISSQWGSL